MSPVDAADVQLAIGSIIKNFKRPIRDSKGNLRLQIIGEEAMVIRQNRIKVSGLKIEFYKDKEVDMEITSDESDWWPVEKRLTTSKGIHIKHPTLQVTSNSMEWDMDAESGVFKDNVKVLIKNGVIAEAK